MNRAESLYTWYRLLVRSAPGTIDQFLDRLDTGLPAHWTRDRAYQEDRGHNPNRFRTFLFDPGSGPAFRVWLRRVNPTRVRGSNIQILRDTSNNPADIVLPILGLIDQCVRPVAADLGASVTTPAFGPRSVVPWGTLWSLTEFADGFGGVWPLPAESDRLWRESVESASQDRAALDSTEFNTWLADNGWSPEAAKALVDRFYCDLANLDGYDDWRRPA